MSWMRVDMNKVKNLCQEIFQKVGVNPEGSKILADCLVTTSARGIHTHGIMRMDMYTKSLLTGDINPKSNFKIVEDNEATATIDASNGMGHIASAKAMELAIKKAKKVGVGIVGVSHSTHFGAASYYSLLSVRKGLIGLTFTNTPALMAPWGGVEKLVGNNPFSIGLPNNGENSFPVILDMAISKVSNTKIRQTARKSRNEGTEFPEGWILDEKGRPSSDPKDILEKGGTIRPIGNHKGYGLAIIIDILTGVLLNSAFNGFVGRRHTPQPEDVAHLHGALKIDEFTSPQRYQENLDTLIKRIKSSKTAEGTKEIYFPGEMEYYELQKSIEKGVKIKNATYENLKRLAHQFDLPFEL